MATEGMKIFNYYLHTFIRHTYKYSSYSVLRFTIYRDTNKCFMPISTFLFYANIPISSSNSMLH